MYCSHVGLNYRKVLGMFAAFCLAIGVASSSYAGPVQPKVANTVAPFAPRDVRLLNGPFRDAMLRNADYLLKLDPDRLLHRFRLYAGLKPKAPLYGGWEAQGVSGHILGHYLSACARQYASEGDVRFRQRIDYIISELALCQKQRPNGYVGAIPDGDRIFGEISRGIVQCDGGDLNGSWVPWYTMHKLFAGLLDSYELAGNRQALQIARKLGDWAIATTRVLTEEQWQRMLRCEHGGMNETLANLYGFTGEPRYLELARHFYHHAVLDPMAAQQDRLSGLHANTQVPKLIGLARLYELTGKSSDRTASLFFWERVTKHHSYANGGNSDGEHFGEPDHLADRLSPTTSETCNTYNMLKLTRYLTCQKPSVEFADYTERALINHILASQNPKTGMVCYYVPLGQGQEKVYSTPEDSFWCCVGTGIENHTRYTDSIYFHHKDTLIVNQFIASRLEWRDHGVTLKQETAFPQRPSTQLSLTLKKPMSFTLQIRRPGWAGPGFQIKLNGSPLKVTSRPDSYLSITRKWKSGDKLVIQLPMQLRAETMPDNHQRLAVFYGPILLAGDLSTISHEQKLLPAIISNSPNPNIWLLPTTAENNSFYTKQVSTQDPIIFRPFYLTHDHPYTVYWTRSTSKQWGVYKLDYETKEARIRDLVARTIDYFVPGEEQQEHDHALTSDKSATGEWSGQKWRDARDGGGFEFTLAVSPDLPNELYLTYWGSDTGNRVFTVLVDGTKIADQSLNNNAPGRFFDNALELPKTLTHGKKSVRVRLQALPGSMAGGLFGARVVRPAKH